METSEEIRPFFRVLAGVMFALVVASAPSLVWINWTGASWWRGLLWATEFPVDGGVDGILSVQGSLVVVEGKLKLL
jgi:hypothetical protein